MSYKEVCFQNHVNCRLQPEHLRLVADKTVADWRRILAELGIQDYIITTVEEDAYNRGFHHDSREIAYQGYLKWKNVDPCKASFCLLKEALSKAHRNDVREELKQKYVFAARRKVNTTASISVPINYFVGRKKEIKHIVEFTSTSNTNKLLLLYGLPGVGKSELLQQSIQAIKEINPVLDIVKPLFPSNSGETHWGLEDVASSILGELQPEQFHINHRVATLHKLLLSISKHTLLVLEMSGLSFKENTMLVFWSFLQELLRTNNEYLKLIVTSCKNPEINQLKNLQNIDEIHLKGLEKEEVVSLLKMMNPTLTTNYCEKIYQVCGSHPYILRKLGAHIKNFSHSLKELDELIESLKSEKSLEVLQPLISQTILKRDMKIVFDELETSEKETLVQLCGFHEIIPVDALLHVFGKICYNRCKHLYTNHCIIERSSSGSYFKMNMLTRSFICEYASSNSNLRNILQDSKDSVVKYYLKLLSSFDEIYFWPKRLQNESHLHGLVVQYQEQCHVCTSDDCKCSVPKILRYVFQKRKTMLMRSLQQGLQSEKTFVETVNVCSKAVHFLRNVVCYEDLHELYDGIFVQLDKIKDKVGMAITMANLVFIKIYHRVTSEKDENIAYLTKSINFLEKNSFIQGIPDVLVSCYCNRGYLRGFYSSQYGKGVEDIKRARMLLRQLPDTNRRVIVDLTVCGYMSAILYRNKEYYASVLERKRQIDGYRDLLGIHPYTAKTLNYQGQCYAKLGKYQKAINCCLASYHMVRKLNGEGVETMRVLSTYGKVLLKAGRIEQGINKLQCALDDGENALGEHDSTAWCYEQLATEKSNQGYHLEAEELKNKAIAIRRHFAMKSQVSNRKTYSLQLSQDELSRYSFMVQSIEEPEDKYIHFIFSCMFFALVWRIVEIYLKCSREGYKL